MSSRNSVTVASTICRSRRITLSSRAFMPLGQSLKDVTPYVYTCVRGLFVLKGIGSLRTLELSCSVCWGVNGPSECIKISVILSKLMSMLLSVWENVSSPGTEGLAADQAFWPDNSACWAWALFCDLFNGWFSSGGSFGDCHPLPFGGSSPLPSISWAIRLWKRCQIWKIRSNVCMYVCMYVIHQLPSNGLVGVAQSHRI